MVSPPKTDGRYYKVVKYDVDVSGSGFMDEMD